MRYHYTSWNDVDQALESFRYARRALLVVMAIALPFAAWESWGGQPMQGSDLVKSPPAATTEFVGQVHDDACGLTAAAERKIAVLRTYIG
jgi:hypothetical protein